MLHGVAHIRISTSPIHIDGDFYAVFVRGQMSPVRFKIWIEAFRHFYAETNRREVA